MSNYNVFNKLLLFDKQLSDSQWDEQLTRALYHHTPG